MAATKSDLVAAINHLQEMGRQTLAPIPREGWVAPNVDVMLDRCKTSDCPLCSIIVCPHQDPQHFSSAGCPACKEGE